jgi:hypothetical protein
LFLFYEDAYRRLGIIVLVEIALVEIVAAMSLPRRRFPCFDRFVVLCKIDLQSPGTEASARGPDVATIVTCS